MLSERFWQPLVPLAAAIIGGVIASTTAYWTQSQSTKQALGIWQAEETSKRHAVVRTKLEEALRGISEVTLTGICLQAEYERRGSPKRCPVSLDAALDSSTLVFAYGSEQLQDMAEAVLESYYEVYMFLGSEEHEAAIGSWPSGDVDEFETLLRTFGDQFNDFAESLGKEIRMNLNPESEEYL
jgi:predicted ribosomally synthesized peptide with SipW-like signal peptide